MVDLSRFFVSSIRSGFTKWMLKNSVFFLLLSVFPQLALSQVVPTPVVAWTSTEITVLEGESFTNTINVSPDFGRCVFNIFVRDLETTSFEDHNIEGFITTGAFDGREFTFGTTNDSIVEGPERFQLILEEDLTGNSSEQPCLVIDNNVLTVTIEEPTSTTVFFALETSSVNEGAGTVDIEVTSTGAGSVSVSTSDSSDDTATVGSDYTSTFTRLDFSGPGTQVISVPIIDDSETEDDESFLVGLSDASQGTVIEPPLPVSYTHLTLPTTPYV